MASINHVVLSGYVAQDVNVNEGQRSDGSNFMNTRFSLGLSDSFKDQQGNWQNRTKWFNITCWGNTAKYAADHVKKGVEVTVEGHLQPDEYNDKSTGQKINTVSIIADTLKVSLPARKEGSANGNNGSYYGGNNQNNNGNYNNNGNRNYRNNNNNNSNGYNNGGYGAGNNQNNRRYN